MPDKQGFMVADQLPLFDDVPSMTVRLAHVGYSGPVDLRVLSLGAGVQSSAIVEMMVLGELPRVDVAVFADTGADSVLTYEQVGYLEHRLASIDVPLLRVSAGAGLRANIMQGLGRFASAPFHVREGVHVSKLPRQCTSEFKLEPITGAVLGELVGRGLAREVSRSDGRVMRRVVPGVAVGVVLGFSWEELRRALRFGGPAWQVPEFPLMVAGMTREDCKRWLADHGLPVPVRSACVFCPLRSLRDWCELTPVDFESAVEVDEFLRSPDGKARVGSRLRGELYAHFRGVPLRVAASRDGGQ